MRIIGGKLSGRRLSAPSGRGTRPTSDRVREALGSSLQSRGAFEGARVLDLFAGSGALSLEALSRGAAQAVAVDSNAGSLRLVAQNAKELGIQARVQTFRVDLLGDPRAAVQRLPAPEGGFNLVFADAPYAKIDSVPALLRELASSARLAAGAWVVVERPLHHDWVWPNALAPDADYRYGQTGISLGIYEPEKGSQ